MDNCVALGQPKVPQSCQRLFSQDLPGWSLAHTIDGADLFLTEVSQRPRTMTWRAPSR